MGGYRVSPSSQAPLLGPGPLRTGRETFVLIRLKPFERLFQGDAVFDTERRSYADRRAGSWNKFSFYSAMSQF